MMLADMMFRSGISVLASVLLVIPFREFAAIAAEPAVTSNDMPRFPVVEPRDAVKTIQVERGFHVELAASEPNIASPVAIAFDERERMYVVEMIDYSERREES